jgi:hypothetical protein
MLQLKLVCPNKNCNLISEITWTVLTYKSQGKPLVFKGIIKCSECGYERPFVLYGESISLLGSELPGQQSSKLSANVPNDIRDDLKEAEDAYFNQCYKASAAMCRRAVQLALIDKGIQDKGLKTMIEEAKNNQPPILDNDTYNFAISIKGFGDIAIHRKDNLEPDDIPLLLSCTKRMLNELYK